MPTPTSEATFSQWPRTRALLRRSAVPRGSAFELDHRREQRPPNGEPDRDREQDGGRGQHHPGADGDTEGAQQRPELLERAAIGVDRSGLLARVDPDQRAGGGRLDEHEPEQCQCEADCDQKQHEGAGPLARRVDAGEAEAAEDERLEDRDDDADRDQQDPDPEEQERALDVHPAGRREHLPPRPAARQTQRRDRPPRRSGDPEPREPDERRDDEQRQTRVAQELDQGARARLDRLAEEVGRTGAEHAARRHCIGARSPALRPADRLGPLLFQVRAGRPVEERVLQLAPAALVGDPRQRSARCRRPRSGS